MRAFVPTPEAIVDGMIDRLFADAWPKPQSRILDPGCGEGAFIDGLIRWCEGRGLPIPSITGVENHPMRAEDARKKYEKYHSVSIECRDFLVRADSRFDYIIGNPPYVSILQIAEDEREAYRATYESAKGRFDLYMLFFEEALRELRPGGRLVFITPEKFLYVKTCEALRRLLTRHRVLEIALVNENAFKGLVTYPAITSIEMTSSADATLFTDRNGASRIIRLPNDGSSFLPLLTVHEEITSETSLEDICIRVSCGVATGADEIFVRGAADLPTSLKRFAYPTISGRQLLKSAPAQSSDVMLIPYDKSGKLLPESHLGELLGELSPYKADLVKRVCAKKKPWYAFHDNVPFSEMLLPKIICKDITKTPYFWADYEGGIVPRHSVYYIVPRDPDTIDDILQYLNGPVAQAWLQANCQRAANGFLRVQSAALRKLPIPQNVKRGRRRKKTTRGRIAA